jgi:hypothetical protein
VFGPRGDLNGSLDSDVVVGRIYPEIIKGEPKWLWFLRTEPAPEDAKAGFKARYEQVKARAGPAAIGALPRRPRDRCTSYKLPTCCATDVGRIGPSFPEPAPQQTHLKNGNLLDRVGHVGMVLAALRRWGVLDFGIAHRTSRSRDGSQETTGMI